MFKPNMREMLLMPKLGSLEIYTEVPEGTNGVGPVSEFYWRDKRQTQGRGPYNSLWACVEDFKKTMLNIKDPQLPSPPLKPVPLKREVVTIDFVSKKRL